MCGYQLVPEVLESGEGSYTGTVDDVATVVNNMEINTNLPHLKTIRTCTHMYQTATWTMYTKLFYKQSQDIGKSHPVPAHTLPTNKIGGGRDVPIFEILGGDTLKKNSRYPPQGL